MPASPVSMPMRACELSLRNAHLIFNTGTSGEVIMTLTMKPGESSAVAMVLPSLVATSWTVCDLVDGLVGGLGGCDASDQFHQFHHRYRVEERHADEFFGAIGHRREAGDGIEEVL